MMIVGWVCILRVTHTNERTHSALQITLHNMNKIPFVELCSLLVHSLSVRSELAGTYVG